MIINMTFILHCKGHNYLGTVIELPPCASETRRHTREQIEIMSNEAAQYPAEVSIFVFFCFADSYWRNCQVPQNHILIGPSAVV